MIRFTLLVAAVVLVPACGHHQSPDDVVLAAIPSPPTAFALSTPSDSAIGESLTPILGWTDASGEDSYMVEIDTEATFSVPITYRATGLPADTTQFIVPSATLSPATTYYWRVIAQNLAGTQAASNAPFTFTTYSLPPTPFTLSTPTDQALGESVTPALTWTDSSGEDSYIVEIDTEASFSVPITYRATGLPADTTQFIVPSATLSPATTYYWRVIAQNLAGTQAASNAPFTFTTYSALPTAFGLSMPTDSAAGVSLTPTLSWTDASLEESYTVQVAMNSSFSAPLAYEATSLAADTTQFTLPPGVLSTSTLYYWRVISGNSFGTQMASNAPFSFTTGAYPSWFNLSRPFDGMGNMPTAITLEWTNPTGETSFIVQIDTDSSFAPPLTYEAVAIPAESYFHNVPVGVLNGTRTYYWRIIAMNAVGSTVAANAPFRFTTTMAPTPFDLVSPSDQTSGVSRTPTLTWTATTGHVYYILEMATQSAFTGPLAYTTIVPSANFSQTVPPGTLQPLTLYYWRVVAVSINGGYTVASNAPFSLTTQ